jgi:CheY-like chemotaxis protein
MILRHFGHEATAAYDATNALAAIRVIRPNLIISELALRGTDGFRFARELKDAGLLEFAFLAALSGYCRKSDRQMAAAAGFDAFLAKPASLNDFVRLLAQSSAARALRCRGAGACAADNSPFTGETP